MEILDPSCSTIGCCYNDPIYQDNDLENHDDEALYEKYRSARETWASRKDMKDENALLCPCWVLGYVLRSRKWGKLQTIQDVEYPLMDSTVVLDVDLVKDLEENNNSFGSLVLYVAIVLSRAGSVNTNHLGQRDTKKHC